MFFPIQNIPKPGIPHEIPPGSAWQVPLIASLGFEPTALGVCQATKAVLQFHHEGKARALQAGVYGWFIVHLIHNIYIYTYIHIYIYAYI